MNGIQEVSGSIPLISTNNRICFPLIRGYSSAGRALEWHSRGQRFDPAYLHHFWRETLKVPWSRKIPRNFLFQTNSKRLHGRILCFSSTPFRSLRLRSGLTRNRPRRLEWGRFFRLEPVQEAQKTAAFSCFYRKNFISMSSTNSALKISNFTQSQFTAYPHALYSFGIALYR